MQIKKTIIDAAKRKKLFDNPMQLPFGRYFTDHMFTMEYRADLGWTNAEIKPYQPLSLEPSSNIFHYGQSAFEGQKAFRSRNGEILLFRPEENAKRLNKSLARMCMPEIPVENYLSALNELVRTEERWVPKVRGTSLYIRPMVIGSEPTLGVRSSAEYIFCIMLSPAGPYFPKGFMPISLWVSDSYIRAAIGGTGEAKTGGNYAASLIGGKIAHEKGCDQVLWLDAREFKYVEEGGGMNIFFVIDNELTTPELSGSILPGITRKSVLELAPKLGIRCRERQIDIDEVIAGIENKRLSEIFCTGTAVVINPVKSLLYKNQIYNVSNPNGIWAQKIYDYMTGLQYGEIVDDSNWIRKVAAC